MDIELYKYAVLFVVACGAGFVDAVSGGGGMITIPALFACGVPPYLALATNKLQGCFGTLTSSLIYLKHIKLEKILLGIICAVIGACIGVKLAMNLAQDKIYLYILIILSLLFIYMIFRPNMGKVAGKKRLNRTSFYLIFGLLLGFYDGFLGAGAGSFWIFAFVFFLGLDIKEANMNTKILNLSSNLASLLIFVFFYKILWPLGLVMGLGQILGGFLGAKTVLKINPRIIKIVFLCVVFCTICKLFYSYFF